MRRALPVDSGATVAAASAVVMMRVCACSGRPASSGWQSLKSRLADTTAIGGMGGFPARSSGQICDSVTGL